MSDVNLIGDGKPRKIEINPTKWITPDIDILVEMFERAGLDIESVKDTDKTTYIFVSSPYACPLQFSFDKDGKLTEIFS